MKYLNQFLAEGPRRGLVFQIKEFHQTPGYFRAAKFYAAGFWPSEKDPEAAVCCRLGRTWYPICVGTEIGDCIDRLARKMNDLHYGHLPRSIALIANAYYFASESSESWLENCPTLDEAMHAPDLGFYFQEYFEKKKAQSS